MCKGRLANKKVLDRLSWLWKKDVQQAPFPTAKIHIFCKLLVTFQKFILSSSTYSAIRTEHVQVWCFSSKKYGFFLSEHERIFFILCPKSFVALILQV